MRERVQKLYDILQAGEYKTCRSQELIEDEKADLLPLMTRSSVLLKKMLESEKIWFHPDERIGFNRYHAKPPAIYGIMPKIQKKMFAAGNLTPDYGRVMAKGMDAVRAELLAKLETCQDAQKEFYEAVLLAVEATLAYADRTREAAKEAGLRELYDALCQVPHKPARTFLEACVFMKFIIFTLRCNCVNHVTLGRFDQYMLPYYNYDIQNGASREDMLETVQEFFISLNFDGDVYHGIQVGDNGQSMVLGGYDLQGRDMYNDLSQLCMEASLELKLIDPKINLRVNKTTPIERLEFGTQMTRQGLGFPQYCNDDIAVPGLIKVGYAPEDAVNYTVAACWEFIIPGKGADIPNIVTMNFPMVVEQVVEESLESADSFDVLLEAVGEGIRKECDSLIERVWRKDIFPVPYLSVFVEGCIEKGLDVSQGGSVYLNFGCHGAGISTAADALAAIRQVIFEERKCSKRELLDALKNNFEGYGELRNLLLSCPKMGNNDDRVDSIGCQLMAYFSSYMNGKPNGYGGFYRAGTGSAMEYVLSAAKVGATADGRKSGDVFGSSFSPSLNCRLSGPLSCIQSFTKFDMTDIINGGPLTLEVHDSTFRNEDGIQKVAQLVKAFINLGGHQLQLNAVNRDRLLDAQKHPENYKNLIVRVWGWSGYFTELDKEYQNHIIRRTEFQV